MKASASIILKSSYIPAMPHEPMIRLAAKVLNAPLSPSPADSYSLYVGLAIPAAGLFFLMIPKIQQLALRIRLLE